MIKLLQGRLDAAKYIVQTFFRNRLKSIIYIVQHINVDILNKNEGMIIRYNLEEKNDVF